MDDLLSDFIAETRETLEAIAGEIVAWEATPEDRARLDAIFRFVHTVKGSCGFLELPRLERLSHAAEDALAAVRSEARAPDRPLVSAILAIIDRISLLVGALESGASISDDDANLIRALAPGCPAEEPAPPAEANLASRAAPRSIRVPVELLDRMMGGVSDVVLARNELSRRLRGSEPDLFVEAAFERLSAAVAEMRDSITRTRMQRIENLFMALPRAVRDVAAELGKQVALRIDGGDVELDREMIEMIRDPLTHIVRNAIDHGIEAPEARRAAGKPATGTLRVSARQSGNQILIEVADDGRGIDGSRLAEQAIAAGIFDRERAAALSEAARIALIFEPGLSTARAITAISGRGVGMDVVRSNVERIGGVIDLDNRTGQGLRITMKVPLTLTIIPALTVTAGGHAFAVPRAAIQEILRAKADSTRIEQIGGTSIASIRGKRMPLVDLGALMGSPPGDVAILILLKPAGSRTFALGVGQVHDHEELVVKPAAPAVMHTGLYAGTTLPDNGQPMLLLDAAGIAATVGIGADCDVRSAAPEPAQAEAPTFPTLLFRDLDGAVRALRLAVVERIEDVPMAAVGTSAGRLRLVQDGRLLSLIARGSLEERTGIRILRVTDGTVEVGYAIDAVIDIANLLEPQVTGGDDRTTLGVMLVDGAPVELIDPYWLFAQADGDGPRAVGPLCVLRGAGDPWTRTILQPLLINAGYRVALAGEGDEAGAAVIIAPAGSPHEDTAVPLIRIRAEAARGQGDESIYRYDRGGLFAALDAAVAAGR